MKKLRTSIVAFAALAVLLASQVTAIASQDTTFIVRPGDGDMTTGDPLRVLVNLQIEDGLSLEFVEVRNHRGAVDGIMIVQAIPAGSMNYQSIERLQGVNPVEVFNALSEPGTAIPQDMIAVYGRPALGEQGWGLPLISADGHVGSSCTNESVWAAGLNTDHTHYFESKFDGPSTKPQHWKAPQPGHIGWNLYGYAYKVTAFSVSVVLCHTDLQYPYHSAGIAVRPAGQGGFSYHFLDPDGYGRFKKVGDVVAVDYTPVNAYYPSATEYDIRLRIHTLQFDPYYEDLITDLFHIGATWETRLTGIVPK